MACTHANHKGPAGLAIRADPISVSRIVVQQAAIDELVARNYAPQDVPEQHIKRAAYPEDQ